MYNPYKDDTSWNDSYFYIDSQNPFKKKPKQPVNPFLQFSSDDWNSTQNDLQPLQAIQPNINPSDDIWNTVQSYQPVDLNTDDVWAFANKQQPQSSNAIKSTIVPTTKQERDLLMRIGGDAPELNFWKDDKGFTEWLLNKNVNPDILRGWEGAKLYKSYIQWKAENPAFLGQMSNSASKILSGLIGTISNSVEKVPLLNKIAPLAGSAFKFIGNLLDVVRNVPAGVVTALFSGHINEIPDNVLQALKHAISSGTEGKYFSWADFGLRNMVDKLEGAMSPTEFKSYINSNQYRATKRLWQGSGLLLDMVLDPLWVTGIGGMKGRQATRALEYAGAERSFNRVASTIGETTRGVKAYENSMGVFLNKTDEWLKFLRETDNVELLGVPADSVNKASRLLRDVKARFAGEQASGLLIQKNDAVYNKFADSILDLVQDYQTTLNQSPYLYDKYLGHGLKLYKPFSHRGVVLKEVALPLRTVWNKIFDIFGSDPNMFVSKIHGRNIDKFALKTSLSTVKAVRDKFLMDDLDLHKVLKSQEEVIPIIKESLKKNGLKKVSDAEVMDVFHEILQYKAKTHVQLPDFMAKEMSDKFTLDNADVYVPATGLQNIMNVSRKFIETEPELLNHPAVKKLVSGWDSLAQKYLARENQARKMFTDFYFQKKWLKKSKDGKRLELLEGDKYVTIPKGALKTDPFLDDFYNYVYARSNPEFWNKIRNIEPRIDAPSLKSGMIQPKHRLNLLPTDLLNNKLQSVLWGEEQGLKKVTEITEREAEIKRLTESGVSSTDATSRIAELHSAQQTAISDLWFDTLSKLRKIAHAPAEFGKFQQLMEDGLIQYHSPVLVNELAKKGFLYRNITEPPYLIDNQNILAKAKQSYEILGKAEAAIGLDKLAHSLRLVKVYNKSLKSYSKRPAPFLGRYPFVRGEGLFANYWIPEYMRGTTKALSEGITQMVHPIEVQIYGGIAKVPFLRTIAKINAWWRPNVTMKIPAFHSRNNITNIIMSISEGRFKYAFDEIGRDALKIWEYGRLKKMQLLEPEKLKRFGRAETLKKLEDPTVSRVLVGDNSYSVPEAYFHAVEHRVAGNALTTEIMFAAKQATEMAETNLNKKALLTIRDKMGKAWRSKYNIFGSNDVATMTGATVSSAIEEGLGRIPLWLHHTRNNGMSMMEAAQRVNHIFIDYTSLTRGQRALKNYLIPFFTWQYKMIEVVLKKAITSPTMFTKVVQANNNLRRMLETDQRLISHMEQETEGIPTLTIEWGKFFAGEPMSKLHPKFLAAERFLPQAVINLADVRTPTDLLNPVNYINGIMKKFVEATSPAVKYMLIESPLGFNLREKAPFSQYIGERQKFLGIQMTPKQRHVINSAFGWFRILDDTLEMFQQNDYTGSKLNIVDWSLKHLTGFKPYTKDEIRQLDIIIGKMKDAYRGNIRAANNKQYNKQAVEQHLNTAIQAKYSLDILVYWKKFLLQHKDDKAYQELLQEQKQKELNKLKKKKSRRKKKSEYSLFF